MPNILSRLGNSAKKKNDSSGLAIDVIAELKVHCATLEPTESLRLLFSIDNELYKLEGQEAIRYGNGTHTKHKHIRYHDFFTKHIETSDNVLDIGCSTGELTADISGKVSAGKVVGIEIEDYKVQIAKSKYQKNNLLFVMGDATDPNILPEFKVDVITLSNVLEHIEFRVDFLQLLQRTYHPDKYIIRVPMFERDWRVPLKDELGMDSRLDETHFIEYTQEGFIREITAAGLQVDHLECRWGELWTIVITPNK